MRKRHRLSEERDALDGRRHGQRVRAQAGARRPIACPPFGSNVSPAQVLDWGNGRESRDIEPPMSNSVSRSDTGDTIVTIPQTSKLQPLVHDPSGLDEGTAIHEAQFKIRLANTEGRRSSASYLIARRYAWRGYEAAPVAPQSSNMITLAAFQGDLPIATITVGTDSAAGLAVESLYPVEVRLLRDAGKQLCEFTKLAVDNMIRSKAILAAIFHIAYIYARRMRRNSDLLIEVNPRHVKFYQAMLGFIAIGSQRIDPRVNAPAVLLRLDLSYAEMEIERWCGHRELAGQTRLLYPLFFAPAEEKGIEGRLRLME